MAEHAAAVAVYDSAADVATAGAERVRAVLSQAVAQRGLASFVLSGGGTPLDLYRRLAAEPAGVPWAQVHVFWGDERLVPPDDPGSNFGQAQAALLRHLPLPPANVHRVRGELPPDAAVEDYRAQLRAFAVAHDADRSAPWPRFDLVLLGLGGDGHTVSLFPGSPVEAAEPVIAVMADYGGRPAHRVTLTPPVLNDARDVLFLATGASKAEAVRATIEGESNPVALPGQRITPVAGRVTWLLDVAAARLLTAAHPLESL